MVVGTVLPDLLKNANKSWVLHPAKRQQLFSDDPILLSILSGWNRHLMVDKKFHSSVFFLEHTKAIRTLIIPILEGSPVRPSFLAHIALELMLDSLLITESRIRAEEFYQHLEATDRGSLRLFLNLNGISDPDPFFQFFDKFISSAYLKTYREPHNIIYALNRICMRLWQDPLNEVQKLLLTEVLIDYQEGLKTKFIDIFNEIEGELVKG